MGYIAVRDTGVDNIVEGDRGVKDTVWVFFSVIVTDMVRTKSCPNRDHLE